VGVRGSRIKNIVDELGGEKIDIVRWNESSQILIGNALKPAEVTEVALCFELGRATVVVNDDQLSLAIGKRGQNVRLAARLTGWDVDILTPPEFQAGTARLDQVLKSIDGITQEQVDKIVALGLIDVRDIEEVGAGPLMEELGLDEEKAQFIVDRCSEEAKLVAIEQEAKKAAEAKAKAADRIAMSAAAARGVDGVAFANPLMPQAPMDAAGAEEPATVSAGDDDAAANRMPGALEATDGIAPELVTHSESSIGNGSELSPEERAISGIEGADGEGDPDGKDFADEDSEAAALAEGRIAPPASTGSETA
jgi:N utilization substance protein A